MVASAQYARFIPMATDMLQRKGLAGAIAIKLSLSVLLSPNNQATCFCVLAIDAFMAALEISRWLAGKHTALDKRKMASNKIIHLGCCWTLSLAVLCAYDVKPLVSIETLSVLNSLALQLAFHGLDYSAIGFILVSSMAYLLDWNEPWQEWPQPTLFALMIICTFN